MNRRLQLLSSLPDAALAAVRAGRLSTWAATRVIAPLARASGAHAERLLVALAKAPLSTRELKHWFDHYQKVSRAVRERLVEHPQLFVQALNESAEQDRIERLRMGPEGECEVDLVRINGLIHRVRRRLPMLCPISAQLVRALSRAQGNFDGLQDDIKRYSQYDPNRDPKRCAASEGAGPEPARDQHAVRRVLREKDGEGAPSPPCDAATLVRLEEAFKRARGNGVRVQELLASENGLHVPYSTLTR